MKNPTAAERARFREETWKGITKEAEPGDEASGQLLSRKDNVPGVQGERTLLRIWDGEFTVHLVFCSRSVLRNEVLAKDPQPGDQIAIVYKGEKMKKDGTPFHSYTVEVDKPEGTNGTKDQVPPSPEPYDDRPQDYFN